MKFFLALSLLLASVLSINGDLLDGLDHHDHDHDHHDDHHEELSDLHDHLEDQLEDQLEDRHQTELEKQLLREIEQFLPNEESTFLIPTNNEPSNFRSGLQGQVGGVPLVPQVNSIPNNQLSQIQGPPPKPQPAVDPLPQRSFGIVPQSPVAFSQPIARAESNELFDSEEDPSFFDVEVSNFGSAPFSVDSAHDDYDDINNNLIGGQGRQLNAGQAPQAPNSFSLLDGDYPQYAIVPRTAFSCGDQQFGGYYADTEAECQAFHICLEGGLMGSFLCPNGTLFNQQLFVCDWWFNVDCTVAPLSYPLNARIGIVPGSDEDYS